ncbi:MAG: hypothetical protein COU33_03385, partial [Candidatus Magasanikbacteria bacterium CG10_big_fil_rev_8_21_14_0_10_43_6]
TSTSVTGLTPNTNYTLSVQGTNAAGNSDRATTIVYTLANIPSALVNTAKSETSITMEWSSNSNSAGTEYCIVIGSNTCGSGDWQTDRSKVFSGLTKGTAYLFKVKARNGIGTETAFTDAVSVTTNAQQGGGGDGGGGGGAPATPDPLPPPEDIPPLEPLAPTGLIQIVDTNETDFLELANLQKNYEVDAYSDVVAVNSFDDALDLDEPFRLEISFTPLTSPMWREGMVNMIFEKNGAYSAGYGSTVGEIGLNGFCFYLLNPVTKVCEKELKSPFVKYTYVVRWDGSTLSLLDGSETKKYSSVELKSVGTSADKLTIGGTKTGNAATFFPHILHKLSVKQEQTVVYTNQTQITLKIDATYANLLWLNESTGAPDSDFTSATMDDIEPERDWTLSGEDGKKCINAKFLNQPTASNPGSSYEFITYACVILDTQKPSSQFTFDDGVVAGKQANKPRVYGTSDAHANISITREKIDAGIQLYNKNNSFIDTGYALIAAANVTPQYSGHLAGQTETYSTSADEDGDWEYTFSDTFDKGDYTITVQSSDLAGNSSNPASQKVT